jgi:hypothetical protein
MDAQLAEHHLGHFLIDWIVLSYDDINLSSIPSWSFIGSLGTKAHFQN